MLSWRSVPKAVDYLALLGATIREERRRAGFSQEELAEKAELHPNYLGRVERGEEQISVAALVRLARALKIQVHDLTRDF